MVNKQLNALLKMYKATPYCKAATDSEMLKK